MNKEELANIRLKESLELLGAFVLIVIGCIATLARLVSSGYTLINIVNLVTYGVLIYYAGWGFKKPHGNALKYAMLCLAVSMMMRTVILAATGSPVQIMTASSLGACAILITYMCGRLDRIEQGRIICIAVIAIQVLQSIIRVCCGAQDFLRLGTAITSLNALIQCLVAAGAYLARYRRHKKAGLEDRPAE